MKEKSMRLIDAVWLEEKLKEALDVIANDMSDAVLSDDEEIIIAAKNQHSAYATALTLLKHAPKIEAAPVVHGEVVTVFEKAIGHQRCSVCGNELEWKAYPNYCDNCGAKLKGVSDQ